MKFHKEYLYLGAAVVGVGVLYFGAKSAGAGIKDAAATVGGWLNPAADTNLAYRGVNGVGSSLTGDPDFSLGSWVYNKTHTDTGTYTGPSLMEVIWGATPMGAAGYVGNKLGDAIGGVWNSTAAYEQKAEGARQIDRIIERQQRELAGLGGVYDDATGEMVGAYDEMGNRIY